MLVKYTDFVETEILSRSTSCTLSAVGCVGCWLVPVVERLVLSFYLLFFLISMCSS